MSKRKITPPRKGRKEPDDCCCNNQQGKPCGLYNRDGKSPFCWVHRKRCDSPIHQNKPEFKRRKCSLRRASLPPSLSPAPLAPLDPAPQSAPRKSENEITRYLKDQEVRNANWALNAQHIAWNLNPKKPNRMPTKAEVHDSNPDNFTKTIVAFIELLEDEGKIKTVKAKSGAGLIGWNKISKYKPLYNKGETLYYDY